MEIQFVDILQRNLIKAVLCPNKESKKKKGKGINNAMHFVPMLMNEMKCKFLSGGQTAFVQRKSLTGCCCPQ